MFETDPEYIEKCIIKTCLENKPYCILITDKFTPDYFDLPEATITFKYLKKHMEEFKDIPQQEIFLNSIEKEEDKKGVVSFLKEINSIDIDTNKSYD